MNLGNAQNMPKISVIMPVYNQEKYLEDCLESILHQSFEDIEVICVDDGSTDTSLSILNRYEKRDLRIKVLQQENQGAGVARNNGLVAAAGEYVIFLDSDDFFDSRLLERLYGEIRKSGSEIVVCRSDRYHQKTKKYIACPWTVRNSLLPEKMPFSSTDIKKDFFKAFVWWPWDKLYRKAFVDRLGIQYQNLRTTNDLFFVAGAMLKAERISYIDDVLVHHRVGMESSLSVTREKSWDCFYKALLQLREFLKQEGLYTRFEQDYINYCLHFSLWNLETLHGYSYCLLYTALRDKWFGELGVSDKPVDYFYNKGEYGMMQHIMQTDLERHLSDLVAKLELKLEQQERNADTARYGKNCYSSRIANAYMRVKLYYKGYGFVNTVKKIMEKLKE